MQSWAGPTWTENKRGTPGHCKRSQDFQMSFHSEMEQSGNVLPKQGRVRWQVSRTMLQEAPVALLKLAQPLRKVETVLNWEEFGHMRTQGSVSRRW